MAEANETAQDQKPDDASVAAEWEAAMAAEDGAAAGGAGGGDAAAPADDPFAVPDTQAARVLNQDEIDSLLGFGAQTSDGGKSDGIQAIVNSALVAYERLPMLEVVFDRLVRMMTTSLRNFTSDNVEVSMDNMTSIRFGDYLNSIPLPAMLGVFKAAEWDNYGLIVVDSSLIYSIVDVLLGGRRGTAPMRIEGRPYTTIERNLVERMIGVVLQDMKIAFEPLSKVDFVFDRLEINPRFATIARPANAAVLAKLRIDMEDRGGKMEFLLPYATLEPVRELLLQMFMGERFGRDSIWEGHLASELWQTDVDLRAVLDQQTMTLGDVIDWKVGSQLKLNASPQSTVNLRCGDVSLFAGAMGRRNNNVAIRIDRVFRREK
jgi:flagellar motor switch protein FliM